MLSWMRLHRGFRLDRFRSLTLQSIIFIYIVFFVLCSMSRTRVITVQSPESKAAWLGQSFTLRLTLRKFDLVGVEYSFFSWLNLLTPLSEHCNLANSHIVDHWIVSCPSHCLENGTMACYETRTMTLFLGKRQARVGSLPPLPPRPPVCV